MPTRTTGILCAVFLIAGAGIVFARNAAGAASAGAQGGPVASSTRPAATGSATSPEPAGPASAARAACPALLNVSAPRLQDEQPQQLCQYAGKVVLVVNTASLCGYTPQYEGLETLYDRYRSRGLVVLGFPSNQFGGQEPGSNRQIADFCANTFGVRFPMFARTTVTGAHAHPLFAELTRQTGTAPQWNFHKYLIGRDGRVLGQYPSAVRPLDRPLVRDIERALGGG